MSKMQPLTKEQLTEQIQKEYYDYLDEIIKATGGDVSVPPVTNLFLFSKLAEIELRLRELEQTATPDRE
jgi:hypothetical protein